MVGLATAAMMVLAVLLSVVTAPGVGADEKPRQKVLSWHREGGIAGFCDDLTIDDAGEFLASRCGGPAPRNLGGGRLSAEQLGELERWRSQLAPFTWEHTDPATADAMTVRLVFVGRGDGRVDAEQRAAMLELASTLYGEQLRGARGR